MSDCWELTNKPRPNGYVRLTIKRKSVYAHRHIWESFFGEIPEGMDVCHKCDNRKCVNPEHLFLGSRKDNMRDAKIKGRLQRGEDRWNAALTERDVRAIRLSAKTATSLATRYGVCRATITKIINRETWRHVT